MATVNIGATGNPITNNYAAYLNGGAGDTYKITGSFPSNGTSVNYSGPGTVNYSAGDDFFTITGAGAQQTNLIVFSFNGGTTGGGDPHVKPLEGDDYTL